MAINMPSMDDRGYVANTFEVAPDWVIEILSPEQRQNRVTRNILHCLEHGRQSGWLIDPEDESVLVYLPKQQPEFFDRPTDTLPVPAFGVGLEWTIADTIDLMKG